MTAISVCSQHPDNNLIFPIISSILVTLFLFFIDEGYYNFNWMSGWVNWLCFVMYSGGILGGQLLVRRLFLYKLKSGWTKNALMFFIGCPIGFFLTLWMFFW